MYTEDAKKLILSGCQIDHEKLQEASRLLHKAIFTGNPEADFNDPVMMEAFHLLHLVRNILAISRNE
jgi:hypothetical protein